MTTAKDEIWKEIEKFSTEIVKWDKISRERELTFQEKSEHDVRIGWERGLSWAFTVIKLEEEGKLDAVLSMLKSQFDISEV